MKKNIFKALDSIGQGCYLKKEQYKGGIKKGWFTFWMGVFDLMAGWFYSET